MTDFWSAGYTGSELDEAQERYRLRFPADLVAMFLDRRPTYGYDWRGENQSIRRMLAWPAQMIMLDVEKGFWWPEWGSRPNSAEECHELVERFLQTTPRLIPIIKHRFIPEDPFQPGNPVFSMHGFDTIYYGANLLEFFQNEYQNEYHVGAVRHIPFWSDIVERSDEAYAFFEAFLHP